MVDVQVPTSVFLVNGHPASAWILPVTSCKRPLPSASELCPWMLRREVRRYGNDVNNTAAYCPFHFRTSSQPHPPSAWFFPHQFPSALGFDVPLIVGESAYESPSQWDGCIIRGSPERQHIGIDIWKEWCSHMERGFIIGIVTCAYGDWEVLHSSILQLETQEGQWLNLVQIWSPDNLGLLVLSARVWRLRTRSPSDPGQRKMDDVPAEEGQEGVCPSSAFCSIQTLKGLDAAHQHWWGWISLLSRLIQMQFSSRNSIIDTPRNNVTSYLVVPQSNQVDITINHHNEKNQDCSERYVGIMMCLCHSSWVCATGLQWFGARPTWFHAVHRVFSYLTRLSNILEGIPANEKPVRNFLSLETNSTIC